VKEVFLADHVSAVPNAGFNGTADLDVAHSARGILGFFVIDLLSDEGAGTRKSRKRSGQEQCRANSAKPASLVLHLQPICAA